MVKIKYLSIILAFQILCGCSYESTPQFLEKDEYFELSVASKVDGTRTTISDNVSTTSFNFCAGDEIGLFIGNLHSNCRLSCTDAPSGTFSAKIKGVHVSSPSVDYYSYYPYGSAAGTSPDELTAILPGVQSAPFDSAADYLVATPIQAEYDEEDMPPLSFSFSNHLFGLVKLSVKDGSAAYGSEKILSIGLKSSGTPLSGQFSFDITDPKETAVFSPAAGLTSKKVSVEYSEESAPVLGNDEIHSVYAVVNPASFAAGSLSLVVSTTNYVFTVPTKVTLNIQRNQMTVLPVVDLSSASVSRRDRKQTIVLWGDSICGSSFLSSVRKELGPNWTVARGGVAGYSARQVAAMQGGLPMVSGAQFTIPASSTEYVDIDGIYVKEGTPGDYKYTQGTSEWTFKKGYSPMLNPLIIQGVECEISYDTSRGQRMIRRYTDGESVVVPEHSEVSTFGAREYADAAVIVVYIGTNGRPSDSYLISVHDAMKAHLTDPEAKMIVMGFHQSPTDMPQYWTPAYVSAFTEAYGDCFIDQRTLGGGENAIALMKEIGQISDESQISAEDLTYINRGDWPISWFRAVGDVHPNDQYGTPARAILLRRRMDDLGLL